MKYQRTQTAPSPATAVMVFLATAAMLLGGCEKKEEKVIPPRVVDVEVMTITPMPTYEHTVIKRAKVVPNRTVVLSAEVDGRVNAICCGEGVSVLGSGPNRSEIIRLKTDILQPQYDQAVAGLTRTKAAVTQAKATIKSAEAQARFDTADYARVKRLAEKNNANQSELEKALATMETSNASVEEAKAGLKQAEASVIEATAALALARANLDRAVIFSPVDGILNDLKVELGEFVTAGTPVAEIVDTSIVKVTVDMPERNIQYVNKGDEALILYSVRGQKRQRKAKITYIDSLAHEQSLTTRVELAIPNDNGELRCGRIAKVRFTLEKLTDVIMIPMKAMTTMDSEGPQTNHAVYVVDGDKARRVNVVGGFMKGNDIRIVSGLKAGDRIIITGQRNVTNQQLVRIMKKDSTSGPVAELVADKK